MYLSDISEPGNFHEHSEHDVKAPPHIWTVFRPRRAVHSSPSSTFQLGWQTLLNEMGKNVNEPRR
jgi:hypothetical protein